MMPEVNQEMLSALRGLVAVAILDPDKFEAHHTAHGFKMSPEEKQVCDAIRTAKLAVANAETHAAADTELFDACKSLIWAKDTPFCGEQFDDAIEDIRKAITKAGEQ